MEAFQSDKPIYVAFADDHKIVRESVVFFLESQAEIKVVIQASNGKDLLEKLESAKIQPQVCILDIMMPLMNGFETIGRLKTKYPDLKILVLSGFLREPYIINMIKAGANGYLSKNCHPKEIAQAIQEIVNGDFYCGENFTPRFVTAVRKSEAKTANLTEREAQLLKWCIEDMTYGEISRKMNTTEKSIEGYRNKLFQKLGVKTRVGLAIYAIKYGYVTVEPGPIPN